MVDNDLQQNIDQQVSNLLIDQVTKVPTSKPKVKNPERVAAGKKLSQYNKKARQSHDAVVKEEQKIVQENDQIENNNNDNDNQFFPKTSFTLIIALLSLGLTAIDLFLRYKNQRAVSKIDNFENNIVAINNNSEFTDRDREINPNEVDIKNSNGVSKSIGGME